MFIFECACPFHSTSNEDELQKVIAMQTEKRKIENENLKKRKLEKAGAAAAAQRAARASHEGTAEAQASLNLPAVSTTSSVEEQDVRMEMEMGFDNSPSIGEKAMKVDCDKGPALKVDPAAALTEDLDWDLGYLL